MKSTASRHPAPRWIALAAAASLLSACSILQEDKIDYTTAKRGNDLEVPPDLTQLSRQSRYALPSDVVSASGVNAKPSGPSTGVALAPNQAQTMRLERAGAQRWLVVGVSPDVLWPTVREFWKTNGFELILNDETLGIMETEWAENRAKIPQDFLRRSLGGLLDAFYSTSERDKFRTRLERRADGSTEIYISHRGMHEVYTSGQEERTVWQPRAADPELEAEFLRRMMVTLGLTQAQAQALSQQAVPVSAARVVNRQGQVWGELGDNLDRAWRRVGLALDRTGFTVEDRKRSEALYFVRFVPPTADKTSKGFLGGIFAGKTEAQPQRYQVLLRSEGAITQIRVQDAQGQALNDEVAKRMLELLVNDLK